MGIAAFALLVASLAVIALNRIPENTLDGRWQLVLIETPEGSVHPESGTEWIEFDGPTFRGEMDCFQFEGEFLVTTAGGFQTGGWGWSGGCEELDGPSQAFDQYFGSISEYQVDPSGLTLESPDASVQFIYESSGA